MASVPRMVLVTRPTDYELLLARHGTRGQAEFFLKNRGQCIDEVHELDTRFRRALQLVLRSVPVNWRTTRVTRADLDRFVFEPGDIVVVLGQDGLVANLAKYLDGQPVIGLNAAPDRFDGVLVRYAPADAAELFHVVEAGQCPLEARTMVQAGLGNGQVLWSLNEIFVGHASHQSARYRIEFGGVTERQSSSGLIVATGTGATGWARSVHKATRSGLTLPAPNEQRLAFFVREPWPSVATGTQVCEGIIESAAGLSVTSEMDEQGVIFGDGMETDRLAFGFGERVEIQLAPRTLNLFAG